MAFTSLVQLVKTFDRHPAWQQQQQFQRLLAAWSEIVGPAVAVNAQPVAVRRQRLMVATASPVWAQTLAFERHHILEKLRRRLPQLACEDIQFSTAQWYQRTDDPSRDSAPWSHHPSRVDGPSARSSQSLPQSAAEAFQRWEKTVRSRTQALPPCPRCGCATPVGELERWSMCSLCVAQTWSGR